MRAGAWQCTEQRVVAQRWCECGDLSVEAIDGLERDPQLLDHDLDLQPIGRDHRSVQSERRGRSDGAYALLDHVGEANIMVPEEPLQACCAGAPDLCQGRPPGQEVAKHKGIPSVEPLDGLREVLLESIAQAVRETDLVMHQLSTLFH